VDRVLAWCSENGITAKGHPLVWDFADPRWLPRDFAEIRALSNSRVRGDRRPLPGSDGDLGRGERATHLGRFNTRLGEWAMSLGAGPYVTEHLKIAAGRQSLRHAARE